MDLQRWTELHDRDPDEYYRTCGVLYRSANSRPPQQLPPDHRPFAGQASGFTGANYPSSSSQCPLGYTYDRRNDTVPSGARPESEARGGPPSAYPGRHNEEVPDAYPGGFQPNNRRQAAGDQPAQHYADQDPFHQSLMRGQMTNEPNFWPSGNTMQHAPNPNAFGRNQLLQEAWTSEPGYRGAYPAYPEYSSQGDIPDQGYPNHPSGYPQANPYASNARRRYDPGASEPYFEDQSQPGRSVRRDGNSDRGMAPSSDTANNRPSYGSEQQPAGMSRDGPSGTKVKKESKS